MLTTVVVWSQGNRGLDRKEILACDRKGEEKRGAATCHSALSDTSLQGANSAAISSGGSPGWSGGRERGYPKREATWKLSRRARPSYWASRISPPFWGGFLLTSRVLPASEGGPAPSSSSRGRAAATAFVALGWERVEAAILAPAHAGRQRGGTVERRKLQLREISWSNRAPSQARKAPSGRAKKYVHRSGGTQDLS